VRHTIQLAYVARSDGSTTEEVLCLGGEGYPGQVTSYCTQDEEGVLCVLVFAKLASDFFR
jgi:hypothetical protein